MKNRPAIKDGDQADDASDDFDLDLDEETLFKLFLALTPEQRDRLMTAEEDDDVVADMLPSLSEKQLGEINQVTLEGLEKKGLFATPSARVVTGPVGDSHFSQSEKELHSLLGDICTLRRKSSFTEQDESYIKLLNKIELLLTEHPSAINSQDTTFLVTPMHVAAGSGLLELVKLLLKFEPDLSLKNCFGETPAERARSWAKNDMVADFIDSKAKEKTASPSM